MGLFDLPRLSTLLTRLNQPPEKTHFDRFIVEKHNETTESGLVYDRFEPIKPSRGLWIAVHGVTLNGKNDYRLQHFGRCLAAAEMTCLIPTLPGLASLDWKIDDVQKLTELLSQCYSKSASRIGLVGFSFGGSYCLLAASAPQTADKVRAVLTFGAYHSFCDLYQLFVNESERTPTTPGGWDDWIYLRLVQAHRQAERVKLSESTRVEVEALLRAYCSSTDEAEKRRYYDQQLKGLPLARCDGESQDRSILDNLSPSGKLSAIACPVLLIHDPNDGIVPAEQAKLLHDELKRCAGKHRHQLLITSLLQHVRPARAFKPREALKLISMLSVLVDSSR